MFYKKPWLYRLEKDYSYSTMRLRHLSEALIVKDYNEWISIECKSPEVWRSTTITIKAGYAWDGCTPKFSILGLMVLGVPDGRLRHNVPMTYHASLVHDALCQFRHELPITKQQVNAIFNDMLWEVGFPLRRLYVGAVNKFGPQDFIREDGL